MDNRPIGVFDSGVGGLTVLQALQHRLPHESTIYLGDLARCPYGPRDQDEVRRFTVQIADYLAAIDIKMLVVACNTATAAAYDVLRDRYPFPVIGVIEPGARAAASRTRNATIGIIATIGTIRSGAYRRAVLNALPKATVVERSASWLVPLIEQGPLARPEVHERLQPTLVGMSAAGVDTLILGCTHFPLAADLFAAIGPDVTIVDSADTTAREVDDTLQLLDLAANGVPSHRWMVTGSATAFADRAETMLYRSQTIETVEFGALTTVAP